MPVPSKTTVCCIRETTRPQRGQRHSILSILDPGLPVPDAFKSLRERERLKLRFNDVIEDFFDAVPPQPEHVARVLAFGRGMVGELTRGCRGEGCRPPSGC